MKVIAETMFYIILVSYTVCVYAQESNITNTTSETDAISQNVTTRRSDQLQISNSLRTIREPDGIVKFYCNARKIVQKFLSTAKINSVVRNIGVCLVNGAMEIIAYYVPSPLIPLVTAAAASIIPFEPVITLRERLPIANYRRAVNSAVNSFLNNFESFKTYDEEQDPYMMRRFNRRFMGPSSKEKKN